MSERFFGGSKKFQNKGPQRSIGFQWLSKEPEGSIGFLKESQRSSKVLRSSARVQQRILSVL